MNAKIRNFVKFFSLNEEIYVNSFNGVEEFFFFQEKKWHTGEDAYPLGVPFP